MVPEEAAQVEVDPEARDRTPAPRACLTATVSAEGVRADAGIAATGGIAEGVAATAGIAEAGEVGSVCVPVNIVCVSVSLLTFV